MASNFDEFAKGQELANNSPLGQMVNQSMKNRLELQMLSKRIEAERMAKGLPVERVQNILQYEGATPKQTNDLNGMGQIYPEEFQALTGATKSVLGIQTKNSLSMPKMHIFHSNANGQQIVGMMDDNGNIVRQTSLGRNLSIDKELRDIKGRFDASNVLLDQIEQQVTPFLSDQSFLNLLKNYPELKVNQLVQYDPQAAMAFNFVRAHAPYFVKTLTNNSRAAFQMAEQFNESLPNEKDTVQTAIAKVQALRRMFENIQYQEMAALAGPTPTMPPKPQGLGGLSNKPKVSQAAKDYYKSLNLKGN